MRIHLVPNEMAGELGYSSKLNAEWEFLSLLHREGRRAAESFLEIDGDNMGARSSVDLDELLEDV